MSIEHIEYILDHYKSPRNYGRLFDPDVSHEEGNPICGDVIRFDLTMGNNRVKDTKFTGKGCAISQASASILTEMIKGRDLDYVKSISSNKMLDSLGMKISPIRLRCALLSLKVLRSALFGINTWPGEEDYISD